VSRSLRNRKTERAVRLLRKASAHSALIDSFRELAAINDHCEAKASVLELLLDTCRKFNFSKPFSMDGVVRHYRAYLLDTHHPEYAADCSEQSATSPNLGREQSYRRGYDQGFHNALESILRGASIERMRERGAAIHAWRRRSIQIVGSPPGYDERFDLSYLDRRQAITPRKRFKVFQRDSFRCQICGRSQANDIILHVDHRISVVDGGSDEMENLQVLCSECNLGKSSDSME